MSKILFGPDEVNSMNQHPYKYVDHKQQYLEKLSKQSTQGQTTRVQIPILQAYKSQYVKMQDNLKIKKLEELKYLNPESFDSIFNEDKSQSQIELQKNKVLKENYYSEFIQKPQDEVTRIQMEEQKVEDEQLIVYGMIESSKNDTKIKRDRKTHQKDIESLKKEMLQIQVQMKVMKPKAQSTELCRNYKMISKLSGSLLNVYNVYFREIADSFIDDILLDEIQYLNQNENDNSSNQKYVKFEQTMEEQSKIMSQIDDVDLKDDVKELMSKINQLVGQE